MHALIIDDHPVFQDALASVLKDLDMRIRIKTAASVAEALALIDRETPYRLVTLDLTMPGLDGFAFLRILQQRRIATSVVVVSAVEDPATMQACIAEGAKGFIPKSWRMDRMQAAVKRVLAGETFLPEEALTGPPAPGAEVQQLVRCKELGLSEKHHRVLKCVAAGMTNKQIAATVHVSVHTVKAHNARLFEALGTANRTDTVMEAVRLGLIDQ